ncbi:MAG: hypothetical protein ABIV39_12810 [Verrucomicrobiota bacterium]
MEAQRTGPGSRSEAGRSLARQDGPAKFFYLRKAAPRFDREFLSAYVGSNMLSCRIAFTALLVVRGFTQPVSGVIRDGGIDPANLGKGDWIYYMSAARAQLGGNVASVSSDASLFAFEKSQGIRYVIVKAGTGSTNFPSAGSPQFTTSLVNAAHNAGLLIFGYTRSYGSNIPGETTLANYVFNCGADGFVFDAEGEWETRTSNPWITNGPAQAWALCGAVRTNWPTKFIAHAPFPIISYHSSFPYKEFGYWCDAVMPQIYHFGWDNVENSISGGINWTDGQWKTWQSGLTDMWTNSIKPLAPVNHVYGPNPPNTGVSHIPDGNVGEFVDGLSSDPNTVTAGGYKGASFWRADLHGSAQWTYIKAATIGNFSNVVNNIVIDNPSATKVGTWSSVKIFGAGSFFGTTDNNPFGTNYFARTKGTGSSHVQFTPNIVTNGDYDVYEWHPTVATNVVASTNVPHLINFNGGSTTVAVNQTSKAGAWNKIGRYNFAAGTSGNIRLTDNLPETGTTVMADGIKLMFAPPASLPPAPTGLAATAVGLSQINLSWTDNSSLETTFVLAQGISSGGPFTNVATLAGGVTTFSQSNLTDNTTYYFVVRAANALGSSANSVPANARTFAAASPELDFTLLPSGQTHIVFAGSSNVTYWVERSTNLVDWQQVTNIFSTNGMFEFLDSSGGTNEMSFYRARR